MISVDPVHTYIVSLSLATLWLVAGAHKLRAFEIFAATLADYRLVSRDWLRPAAMLVVAVELILAAGLIAAATREPALIATAVLLLVYAAAMGINLLRGRRHIDCGCMGPASRQTLSGWLVIRNLVLALAAISAVGLQPRMLVWIDAMTVAAGVFAVICVYVAVNQLIENAPNLARLRQ